MAKSSRGASTPRQSKGRSKTAPELPSEIPPKIPLADLIARSAAGSLTPDERARAFKLDPATTTAFNPRFRIDPATVDVTGLEGTALAAGHALALDADARARAPLAASAPRPNGTYVAEGDSWFRLPIVRTMADFLAETYPIDNLAHPGDTLESMIAAGQYLAFLRAGTVKNLLFSGGGNDILGDDLERCLNIYDNQHSDPADAPYYLTPFFYDRLARIEQLYAGLIAQTGAISPATRIFVHGYDYVVPREHGIYLGVHFERQGLHPRDHGALCEAIVRRMLDLFNSRLAFLAAHHPTFHHVDLRGTVRADEWLDAELHPKEVAARRLAAKFARALGPAPATGGS